MARVATLVALYFGGIIGVGLFVRTTVQVAIGEPVDMGSAPAVGTTMFTLLLLVAAYLPVSGARLAIRAAKQLELTRIADQVGRHDKVLEEQDGPERANRLIAYRERIQRVPEWPFAVGTAPRAILYVARPLLSWIAAALVERALGALLN